MLNALERAERSRKYSLEYYYKNKNKLTDYHKNYCSKNRENINKRMRKWRQDRRIGKQDIKTIPNCYSLEYVRMQTKKHHALKKYGGELNILMLQNLYEDNIKKYGTLTCYLCLKKIEFGQDSLEHKIPACRGGTNSYENLSIAHRKCNAKKWIRTEKEFLEEGNIIL